MLHVCISAICNRCRSLLRVRSRTLPTNCPQAASISSPRVFLTVAITDPFDLYAMDNLRFILNSDVRCVLAAPDDLEFSEDGLDFSNE